MITRIEASELFKKEPEQIEEINGAFYIPIDVVERCLDQFDYETKNFHYTIYKDGYSNLSVAASIEVVISFLDEQDCNFTRSFVGACNFSLASLLPNTHFLATAKSECVKNAASDIGKFFGRGLNKSIEAVPSNNPMVRTEKPKPKPDSKIMKQFADAISRGDEKTAILLSNTYDIKMEADYVEEK